VGALSPLTQTTAGNVVARLVSLGLVPHIELRTLAIDLALSRFLSGAEQPQVLLLGAGSDSRAYRLPALAGVPFFEVDHPSTQREKQKRAAGLTALAQITYVPVDFERDSLRHSLDSTGFDRSKATFVIWEGVTMYLTREAARSTLDVLRELLPRESSLALTYALPQLSPIPSRTRPLVRAMFSLIGEPLRGLYSPHDLGALLAEAGFSAPNDTGPLEWAGALSRTQPIVPILERLAVTTPA
jgi:methyltransferase (TIGR00027 family)